MEFLSNIVKILSKYWKVFFITGVSKTLLLSIITVACGSILGLFICFGRMGKIKPIKWFLTAFVAFIRGTPMLLQLYIGYFVVPKILPFVVNEFVSVAVGLSINSACYVSEVFRSGIQSVDHGQIEAGRSLGLSHNQTMKKIVIPQAIKTILPALGNEFIMITKDTSLASTFFVGEVMTSYLIVKGNTYLTMECLTIVAIVYFVLTTILTKLLSIFEKRLKKND